MRQFLMQIPHEISDAARIDGASEFRIFYQIVLPQALPAIGVISIFAGLHAWNDFLGPLIYLQDEAKYTLSIGLTFFQSQREIQFSLLMAASTLVVLPVVALFLLFQRAFVEGISLGQHQVRVMACSGDGDAALRGGELAAIDGQEREMDGVPLLAFTLSPCEHPITLVHPSDAHHPNEPISVQPVRRAASGADCAAPGRAARLAQCPRAPDRGLVVHRRRRRAPALTPRGLLAGGRDAGPASRPAATVPEDWAGEPVELELWLGGEGFVRLSTGFQAGLEPFHHSFPVAEAAQRRRADHDRGRGGAEGDVRQPHRRAAPGAGPLRRSPARGAGARAGPDDDRPGRAGAGRPRGRAAICSTSSRPRFAIYGPAWPIGIRDGAVAATCSATTTRSAAASTSVPPDYAAEAYRRPPVTRCRSGICRRRRARSNRCRPPRSRRCERARAEVARAAGAAQAGLSAGRAARR